MGEAVGLGREGIRCETGAVPATVIAFCVQRTKTSLGPPPGKTRCRAKARKPAISQDKTILGIKDEKTTNPL